MPAQVDRIIQAIQRHVKGRKLASAIAIAKSRGLVKQAGKHLAPGPKMKGTK